VQKVLPPTPTPPVVEVDCDGVPPPVPPPPDVPVVPPLGLVPPPPVTPAAPPLVPVLPVVALAELVPDVGDAVLEVDDVLVVEAVVAVGAELIGGIVSDGAPVVSLVLLPPVLPQPPAARASTIPPRAIT
jgi:hypothetical protein